MKYKNKRYSIKKHHDTLLIAPDLTPYFSINPSIEYNGNETI